MELLVLFATKVEKWGVGLEIAEIARHPTPESQRPGFPGTPVIAEIGKVRPDFKGTPVIAEIGKARPHP
jgi:hypothetical protein